MCDRRMTITILLRQGYVGQKDGWLWELNKTNVSQMFFHGQVCCKQMSDLPSNSRTA